MFTSGGVKKCTQTTVCAQVDVIRSTLGDATAPARAFVDAARVFAPVRGRSRSFAVGERRLERGVGWWRLSIGAALAGRR